MKRIVKFLSDEEKYYFSEGEEIIFEIEKSDLQFDVKKFYYAFFADAIDYNEVELEYCGPEERDAKRIFDTVNNLYNRIVNRLQEENVSADKEDTIAE